MFTGIISDVGRLLHSKTLSSGKRMRVETSLDTSDFALGESIAVNGVCLTVEEIGKNWFDAGVSPETLEKSSLGSLANGAGVNLERALRPVDRLGGHFVSGHVDAVGRLNSRSREGEFETLTFFAPPEVMRYLVLKGSVAVDGVSLTVASLGTESFSVAAIPHTLSRTTLSEKKAGEGVNLEADILGKYVEKLLGREKPRAGLTLEKLAESGFLR